MTILSTCLHPAGAFHPEQYRRGFAQITKYDETDREFENLSDAHVSQVRRYARAISTSRISPEQAEQLDAIWARFHDPSAGRSTVP